MAVAGSLTYNTEIDKSGFENGLNSLEKSTSSTMSSIKNIVTALGIDKIISKAFEVITNSIGDAISRLDTLNNYTKVMQNLGASAEDAEASLTTLSDGLDGLPTALDDAALGVQRLMASNGDIEKSTSYFLALNDAILAGGASADIQSAALEQMLQMYSVATVDSQAWKSVLTAMPAQLQQVAEAFGYTSTAVSGDFYTALQDGTISMDEFMDKLVELDTEGTDSVTSFSQQARDATDGISTAWTNAQTRITKGVTTIIESFDEWLESEGFGGIADIINDIGTKAKEALEWLAEKLPEILDFFSQMAPVIVAVAAAFTTFKTALAIKDTIDSVKKSFLALNTAIAANPILAIVSLIVALVAAFIYLWNTNEDFRNFWINLWDSIKTAFENVWNAIVTFFTETIPNAFQTLKDKINEICNNIKTFFENLWNSIVTFFTETIPQWIQNVIDWFSNLPYEIGYQIGLLLGNIVQFGIDIWTWITEELPLIIESIIQWFATLPDRIKEWLSNVISKIVDWGQETWTTATTWVSDTIDSIVNWFKELPSKIWTWLTDTIDKIKSWGSDMVDKAKTAASDLVTEVIDKVKELPDKIKEKGKEIVEGLWNGITGMGDWLGSKISSFASGIIDGFTSALGINSPSTEARDEVGRFIPQGVAVGIEADTDSALKAIDKMNDDIIKEMNEAVAFETGSINSNANIKSNNSLLNTLQATFNIDGSVEIDGKKAGRVLAPQITKTLKGAGVY